MGLRATVGVPEKLSHSDVMTAPAPLDLMAMGWSWQAGRKFLKLEVNPSGGVTNDADGANTATWAVHVASTDCTNHNDGSDTCNKLNQTRIVLDLNPTTQQVALDVAALLAGNDLSRNLSDSVGCMAAVFDLDCPSLFARLGLDLATGAQAVTAQTVFRAMPR